MRGRTRRHRRIRAKIFGTAQRPRLAVFRSAKHISAQLIDDDAQRTIASASDRDVAHVEAAPPLTRACAIAASVGTILAERAKEKGIQEVVFDRGGFAYHGRIRALAEGARKAGLKF